MRFGRCCNIGWVTSDTTVGLTVPNLYILCHQKWEWDNYWGHICYNDMAGRGRRRCYYRRGLGCSWGWNSCKENETKTKDTVHFFLLLCFWHLSNQFWNMSNFEYYVIFVLIFLCSFLTPRKQISYWSQKSFTNKKSVFSVSRSWKKLHNIEYSNFVILQNWLMTYQR